MTEYKIPVCSIKYDIEYQPHYFIDGKEVTEKEFKDMKRLEEQECARLHKKQNGKRYPATGVHGDWDDFRKEVCPVTGKNGGRYFPQLARFHGDKTAVVSSVKEAVEIGKKRGMSAERG